MGLAATQIILKPLITEKSTWESDMPRNRYTFKVAKGANKYQIQQAIEEIYDVKVDKVWVMNRKGRTRRTRFGYSNTGDWKKAVVKLSDDHRIDLF